MTLQECIRMARKGDVLGECFRRQCWMDGIMLCIEENANAWYYRHGKTPEESVMGVQFDASMDDVMAHDWVYLSSPLGGTA